MRPTQDNRLSWPILCILLLFATGSAGYSVKRGYVADDCHGQSCNGNQLLEAAWFYAYNPASPYASDPPSPDFVPMHWCQSGQDAPLPPGTNDTFVLGYNEPNLSGQCGLAPADAAKAWAVYLKRWGGGGSQLVSPATAGNGLPWLDGFIGNCSLLYGPKGCQLSFVAVHDYTCNATSLLTYLKTVHDRYNMKVWLTEFSCGDGRDNKPMAKHLAYMTEVFPLLDAAEFVFRYAWMSGSSANRGLLVGPPGNQTLTPVGELFKRL